MLLLPMCALSALTLATTADAHPLPRSGELLTGAATNQAGFASWNRAFGGHLKVRMLFQSWVYDTNPASVLDGPGIPMISWEPWSPPPLGTPIAEQGAAQPAYSNEAIASGAQDAYIYKWARAIKAYGRPVILRPMHEFNGFWYPWSIDPQEFVLAWRQMWDIFHKVGADNVTWVWSFQVNADAVASSWQQQVQPYWPGRKYVDVLGMSLVRFAGVGPTVGFYMSYLALAHSLWGLPTMITEANVDYGLAVPWLTSLRSALAQMPYNRGFIWSQAGSLEQAHTPTAGSMDWDARQDPAAAALLASIATLHP